MASLLRSSFRAPRVLLTNPSISTTPRRFAGDYGSKQSGNAEDVHGSNPKKHLEHPGPEPPSTKAGSGPAANSGDKDGASPKIHQPKSAAEEQNEDVRKHNEDMKNRSEKSANQLGESDNKVDKQFWTGKE
ncbi:hypothetical protein PMZ80_010830 [Knufia obscura]|uniref:Uncharacterized protein n=1 Tax=Knufia obscura TaxID=1635080 RepID=A0ABR0R9F9_9EURO|nr:hypothetical protein PMZ80_010830 [Knufia obscura]